jgi:lipopolysaccharide biosynthesis glycosyltransferase
MKNVVFIPNIDLGNGRSTPYHYSVKSWQKWCDKHDVELLEWTDTIMDHNNFPIIYQREWVFDIIEHNDIDYDQVLIIDADTIVHPDCPNFFERTNHEYTAVVNNGCFEWVTRSINAWGEFMFPDVEKPKVWEYFNTGFIIANKKHKPFFKTIQEFYLENVNRLYEIRNKEKYDGLPIPGVGQTCVNFLVKQHNIKVNYLPERFNLTDLFRKNMLHIPGHNDWSKDELIYKDTGYIFHFNAIPKNERHAEYWMKRTYEEWYD